MYIYNKRVDRGMNLVFVKKNVCGSVWVAQLSQLDN